MMWRASQSDCVIMNLCVKKHTQENVQSRSSASRGTKRKREKEQTMTTNVKYEKNLRANKDDL